MMVLIGKSLLQTVYVEVLSNDTASAVSLVGNGKFSLVHHYIV